MGAGSGVMEVTLVIINIGSILILLSFNKLKQYTIKLPASSTHLPAFLKKQTDHQINKFNADKRSDNSSQAIDQEISSQQGAGTDRFIGHTFQS